MIKIPFFRKNFLQTGSAKVPIKYRRSRMPNLFDRLTRLIVRLLKRINTSKLATRYVAGTESSLSVIQQLNSALAVAGKNAIRTGFYLINPQLVLCVKV